MQKPSSSPELGVTLEQLHSSLWPGPAECLSDKPGSPTSLLPGDRAAALCTLYLPHDYTHPLDLVRFWGSLSEGPKSSSLCNLFLRPLQPVQESRKLFVITFLGSIIWIAMFSYLMVWWAHQVSGDSLPPAGPGVCHLRCVSRIQDYQDPVCLRLPRCV